MIFSNWIPFVVATASLIMCVKGELEIQDRNSYMLVLPNVDAFAGARLGQFFDGVTMKFLPMNIMKPNYPSHLVKISHLNRTIIDVSVETHDFVEFDSKYSITGTLDLSVLAGMISIGGSATFDYQKQHFVKTGKGNVVYKKKTSREDLDLCDQATLAFVDLERLKKKFRGTHVYLGRDMGQKVKTNFNSFDQKNDDRIDLNGSLNVDVRKLGALLGGGIRGTGDYNVGIDKNETAKTVFFLDGEVVNLDAFPLTRDQALSLMRTIHDKLTPLNLPQTLILYSVEYLKETCLPDIVLGDNNILFSVDKDVEDDFVKLLKLLFDYAQYLHQIINNILKDSECIGQRVVGQIKRTATVFNETIRDAQVSTRFAVISARDGTCNSTCFLDNYTKTKEEANLLEMQDQAEVFFRGINQSIQTVHYYRARNIQCFPNSKTTTMLVQQTSAQSLVILYGLPDRLERPFSSSQEEFWLKNFNLMTQTNQKVGAAAFFCDCHLNPEPCPDLRAKNPLIRLYTNGDLASSDYYSSSLLVNSELSLWQNLHVKLGKLKQQQSIIAKIFDDDRKATYSYFLGVPFDLPKLQFTSCEYTRKSTLTFPPNNTAENPNSLPCTEKTSERGRPRVWDSDPYNDMFYEYEYKTSPNFLDNSYFRDKTCFNFSTYIMDLQVQGCLRVYFHANCRTLISVHLSSSVTPVYPLGYTHFSMIKSIGLCHESDVSKFVYDQNIMMITTEIAYQVNHTTCVPLSGYKVGHNNRLEYIEILISKTGMLDAVTEITNPGEEATVLFDLGKNYIDGRLYSGSLGFRREVENCFRVLNIPQTFRQSKQNFELQWEIENKIMYELMNIKATTANFKLYVDYDEYTDTIPLSLTYNVSFPEFPEVVLKYYAPNYFTPATINFYPQPVPTSATTTPMAVTTSTPKAVAVTISTPKPVTSAPSTKLENILTRITEMEFLKIQCPSTVIAYSRLCQGFRFMVRDYDSFGMGYFILYDDNYIIFVVKETADNNILTRIRNGTFSNFLCYPGRRVNNNKYPDLCSVFTVTSYAYKFHKFGNILMYNDEYTVLALKTDVN